MLRVRPYRRTGTSRLWTVAVVFGVLLPLAACNKPKAPAPSETGPKTFATLDDAGAALLAATKTGDRGTLLAIFGPDASDLISPATPRRTRRASSDLRPHIKP